MTPTWTTETERLYASRGIGASLPLLLRPAVVVVDLIKGFTDPAFPAGSDLSPVVIATRRLLDTARAYDVPVIFTTIAFSPLQRDHLPWLRKMPALSGLVEGSHWTIVDPLLAPMPSEPVIAKQAASAFTGTGLGSLLTSLGVDGVIVCGATTSGCVRATAVDACMAGWGVYVPRECVGDRAPEPHEANLFDIQAKYGEVCSLADALAMVEQTENCA